jgi:transcriptional regulator with XRE-family HTH domain
MNLQKAVAIRLVELLRQKGMTRYALCRKIAMSETTVYNIIKGTCKSVNLDTLYLLAQGLEITVIEFLDADIFKPDNIDIV